MNSQIFCTIKFSLKMNFNLSILIKMKRISINLKTSILMNLNISPNNLSTANPKPRILPNLNDPQWHINPKLIINIFLNIPNHNNKIQCIPNKIIMNKT